MNEEAIKQLQAALEVAEQYNLPLRPVVLDLAVPFHGRTVRVRVTLEVDPIEPGICQS